MLFQIKLYVPQFRIDLSKCQVEMHRTNLTMKHQPLKIIVQDNRVLIDV